MRCVVRNEPLAVTGGVRVASREAGQGNTPARATRTAPRPSLPCQTSRNCISSGSDRQRERRRLLRARTAIAIRENVLGIVRSVGIDRIGVLTLTFADRLTDAREAQRRFKSLRTNVITRRYGGYLRVFERQRDGTIHYHLLVPLTGDIRTGYQRPTRQRGRYTASPLLRAEWAFLREALPRYGFGRAELEPVRESPEQLAAYFAKSLAEEPADRTVHDDRVRALEVSRSLRVANTRFSFIGPGSRQWRRKVGQLIAELIDAGDLPPGADLDALTTHFGPAWALRFRQVLMDRPDLPAYAPNPPEFGDEDGGDAPPSPAVSPPATFEVSVGNPSCDMRTKPMNLKSAQQLLSFDFRKEPPATVPPPVLLPLQRRSTVRLHVLNRMLPDMTPVEFADLTDSIKRHGLMRPIVLIDGEILDGRQRYFACLDAGVKPQFRNFGDEPSDGDDATAFIRRENLLHAHRTQDEKAYLKAKLKALAAAYEPNVYKLPK